MKYPFNFEYLKKISSEHCSDVIHKQSYRLMVTWLQNQFHSIFISKSE